MLKSSGAIGRRLFAAVALLLSCLFVLSGVANFAHAADDFLDPAVAFKFSATERPGEIEVRYKVADGYYMYRERFAFAAKGGATLGDAQLPVGKVHFDQTFNKDVETYRGDVVIRIPVKQASGPFDLAVTSQGCADQGICYPPMERIYRVSGAALRAADPNAPPPVNSQVSDLPWYERATNADYAQSLLESGGFFAIIGLYFVAGVVLSLLPCSYPMIPILSAIIIGEGSRVTRGEDSRCRARMFSGWRSSIRRSASRPR